MKLRNSCRLTMLFLCLCIISPVVSGDDYDLPEALKIDLNRLEETWHVLDQFAEKIWPGWKGYQDVPFRFSYPNGVQMLVGHPEPTDGFELVPNVEVRGKKVYVDRTREIAMELKDPIRGGGGILPYGKGKPVLIVDLHMSDAKDDPRMVKSEMPKKYRYASENQILTNIHELFHCYQRTVYRYRFGNLRYNADTNYAVYSEIEGHALERAYIESDDNQARSYLEDFIVARGLKRESMKEIERNQESEDDLMEGTAVYAETMSLEEIKKGYTPFITKEDDPYFFGFEQVDDLLKEKLNFLRNSRAETMNAKGKCYPYGCFQAILLSRFFPGWQENFFQDKKLLDGVIGEFLDLSQEDTDRIAERLKTRYDYDAIVVNHTREIKKRDDALSMIQAREGRVYIINFKPTNEYLDFTKEDESYRVGLMEIFPNGIKEFNIRDVVFKGQKTPILKDQLYYIKWIDTDADPSEKGYQIKFGRKEGENTYYDAEFRTKGFTLTAPKISVKDLPARVKVTVLAKVRE